MTFYLGAPDPNWISLTERPLCVSHTRLRRIRSGFSFPLSYPGGKWVLDSGAYDLIIRHGRHLDTPEHYVRAVRGYDVRIGNLQWAAYAGVDLVHSRLITCGDRSVASRVH